MGFHASFMLAIDSPSFVVGFVVAAIVLVAVLAAANKRLPRERDLDRNTSSSNKRGTRRRTEKDVPESTRDGSSTLEFRYREWTVIARGGLTVLAVLALLSVAFLVKRQDTANTSRPVPSGTADQHQPKVEANVVNVIYRQLESTAGIEQPRFGARSHARQDVVAGRHGRYYLIRLKDAHGQELVFFEGGHYKKDEMGPELNAAIDALRRDVTDALKAGGVDFELFVRGSADKVYDEKKYIGLLPSEDSKTISYYPALDATYNIFEPRLESRRLTRTFNNKDPPNLRAAFVRDRLVGQGFKATVLDGLVTKRANKLDRNLTILLFVSWPSESNVSQ